jgi:hypothetical protein
VRELPEERQGFKNDCPSPVEPTRVSGTSRRWQSDAASARSSRDAIGESFRTAFAPAQSSGPIEPLLDWLRFTKQR